MKKRRSGHIVVMSSVMGLQEWCSMFTLPRSSPLKVLVHAASQAFLHLTPYRLSMIEPGPVHTEFETKMMEDVAKMEYPGADADTIRYLKTFTCHHPEIYLKPWARRQMT
ncbi:hypothetical protein F7725_003282 [Dissostichus mawsoni]|uniref:Uncharacterized protein n=1 Tax=Dissostichus mawsoni TaxID=36200 RepID=A0A7J5Y9X2_DISMA|nr:hypothetical protein F7725_003282 [Dissostichus mawsoni]